MTTYEEWYQEFWRFGSSTDNERAQRAWIEARASLQPLVDKLVRDRRSDKHLGEACEFLVEIGRFYELHPELEKQLYCENKEVEF